MQDEIQRSLGRIEGKLEDVLRRLDAHSERHEEHVKHDDARFNEFEKNIVMLQSDKKAASWVVRVALGVAGFVGFTQIYEWVRG